MRIVAPWSAVKHAVFHRHALEERFQLLLRSVKGLPIASVPILFSQDLGGPDQNALRAHQFGLRELGNPGPLARRRREYRSGCGAVTLLYEGHRFVYVVDRGIAEVHPVLHSKGCQCHRHCHCHPVWPAQQEKQQLCRQKNNRHVREGQQPGLYRHFCHENADRTSRQNSNHRCGQPIDPHLSGTQHRKQ
jgi:hypothetical protein